MKQAMILLMAALTMTSAWAQSKPDGKSAKPSVSGPGTQTEDELYIGARKPMGPKSTSKASARSAKPTDKSEGAQAAPTRGEKK
jgi:hypothetical protein